MTSNVVNSDIYRENKDIYKKGKRRINRVLFSACLCVFLINFSDFAIYYPYKLLEPYVTQYISPSTYEVLANIITYVFSLVIPTLITMAACKSGFKKSVPLKPVLPKNPIGFLLFAFGITLLFNSVISVFLSWSDRFFASEAYLYTATEDIILSFISIAVLPAIFEEILFRGVFLTCTKPMGTRFAVIFSAVIFGLSHGNPTQSLSAFLFGLLLGGVFVSTGSLVPCMLLHFFNNAFAFFANYSVQDMESSSVFLMLLLELIAVGSMVYSIIYLVKFFKIPKRFPIFVKEDREEMLTGSGFSPLRAVFSGVWIYAFGILYIAVIILRYAPNWIKGTVM